MKKIGILGGTFNPIHFGHLHIAEEIAKNCSLDEVRFIPSANPPHKATPQVSAEHRATMVNLAIRNHPTFMLDDCELKREGASYTVDTLTVLRKNLGAQVGLFLIMGSDAFAYFDTWHRWQEILDYCHIVLIERPNHENTLENFSETIKNFYLSHHKNNLQDFQKVPNGFITTQTITPLAISSTDIRERLKNNKSVRDLLPQQVFAYIQENRLYR